MNSPTAGTPVFLIPPHAEAVAEGQVCVVWELGDPGRGMDANLVRLGPGATVTEAEPAATESTDATSTATESTDTTSTDTTSTATAPGVLIVVVAGAGELRTPDAACTLVPGTVAWLPAGTTRSVRAGCGGLTYAAAHRRRPPLTVTPVLHTEAGEAACLLGLVCPECGRLATERDARYCTRCGTGLSDR
ncbi:hypothetical protein ACFV0B_05210 [Streptomyces xanthophaeus]|uniref:hypothetical protein n=1 Tax=Streptomyces xanthophaeus TaxID=67385 RepID=UPI0036C348D2